MIARRAIRWGLLALAALLLVALVAGTWLVQSGGGRDWALARLQASLPADSSLRWQRLEGRLSGPLVVHGLVWEQADGTRLSIGRARIDHSLWPLLAKRLRVRTLELQDVRLRLPEDDAPFEWPQWPEVLPAIDMPLSLSVEHLRVQGLAVVRDGQPLLELDTLAAGLALGPGELHLQRLQARGPRVDASGQLGYYPRDGYRTAVDLRLRGPATDAHPAWQLQVDGRGDLDAFSGRIQGRAPERLLARVSLKDGRQTPQWRVDVDSAGLDPGLFGVDAGAIWRGKLQVAGEAGQVQVDGRVARNDLEIGLDGSRLRASEHGLELAPLQVHLPQGPLQATGTLDFSTAPARFDLVASSAGLRLVGGEDRTEVQASGKLQLQGNLERWELQGAARLQRAGEQASLDLHGRGDADSLSLDRLQARMPTGRLDGTASVHWAKTLGGQLDLQLAGFDPGYFAPDFPGALHGRIHAEVERDAQDRWNADVEIPGLQGSLRGRPLRADAQASWHGESGEGRLALAVGGSRLRASGRFGATLDLSAKAEPLDLADLWPGAAGRLRGTLALRGPRAAPGITADLTGQDLRWGAYQAATLKLRGRLPEAGRGRGQLDLRATRVELNGQRFDDASVAVTGQRGDFQARARLAGPPGQLQTAISVRHQGEDWRGRLSELRLAPSRGPGWSLRAPAAWSLDADGLAFEQACLDAESQAGEVCASLSGAAATVSGRGLQLALVEPWLGEAAIDYQSHGQIRFDGRLTRGEGDAWTGELQVRSDEGGVRLRAEPDVALLAYRDLQVQLQLAQSQLTVTGGASLSQGGSLRVDAAGGLDADAAWRGSVDVDMRNLAWMELLSPDLAAPQGRLQGSLSLAGTRAAPRFGGELQLQQFQGELPALGVTVREGQVRVAGTADGRLAITGSLKSGQGTLTIEGSYDQANDAHPLNVKLRGQDVTVADTSDLKASVSPDMELHYRQGELQLRGEVSVPSARLDLEQLDRGVSPSPDVVVLDPREPGRRAGLLFDTALTVKVGDDVRLKGFGLDGKLGGELVIRDRPGQLAVANGTLSVTGTYEAYGRTLQIRRARLSWVNAPYDNPVLDVLAERDFEDITVGVRVRGTAQAPQTSVTSNPAVSSAEALSWLILGRPLETASGSETQRISANALALSAGTGLLAQKLGVRLGLDSAGVVQSRALGGSALQVGKQLSPRLFVSYGVSLLGTGQVVMLKYLLKRGLSLGLESGTTETAASIEWRKEK